MIYDLRQMHLMLNMFLCIYTHIYIYLDIDVCLEILKKALDANLDMLFLFFSII